MKKMILFLVVFLCINLLPILGQKSYSLNKSVNQKNIYGTPSRIHFNINNISTWVYSNGNMDIKPDGNSGFEFPKGSGKAAIFESGIVWGGKINEKVHVSGSTYAQGLLPGRILEDGTPQNPEDESARIYRVRPDYSYADLSSEVRDEKISYQEIFNNYEKDWNEWPAEWGAPFNDIDNNGIYNPSVDIPGVPGAHQTLWYVANDLDVETCRSLYGADPMKVEFQVTVWGYNMPQSIYDNVMFKKYKLINKNDVDIDSMYISQWADIDIGDAGDDFAGCDTLLNLMYCYNGDNDDGTYGFLIPAIGFQLLQGPIIEGADTDTAMYNNSYKFGYNNIEMKTHYFFIGGDPVYNDPDLGEYVTGALQFYNLFMGRVTTTGKPFIDPVTNNETKFTLSGNPFTNEGWVDGVLHPPGDRRNGLTSGPFELAVGDTQEIVIAEFAEIGTDRLNSLLLLKESAQKLKNNYPNYIEFLDDPISRNIYKVTPSIKQNIYSEYDIIELNIERKDSIEKFSEGNFEFQGYNIYQFTQNSDFSRTGQNIFTFDKVDDVETIFGDKYDPVLGTLINDVIYNGTNSGFPKRIIIDKDYILNSKLIKGKTYNYGISAYLYNKLENKTIETAPKLINVIYQEDLPGPKYDDIIEPTILEGNSDAEFIIEVVDPEELTGDTYEITFAEQHYYLDKDGEWKKTNYPDSIGKKLAKPNDQTLSRIIPLTSIYAANSTIDLHFMVENNAPDFNYIDAISITFPEGIIINSANNIYSNHSAYPDIEGQTVSWGEPFALSADGPFTGGEELKININYVEPTFTVDYVIYDDGWSEAYAATDSQYFLAGAGTVDGYGSVKLTGEVGYQFKTVPYWRLTNKTTDEVKLEEIEIVGISRYHKNYGAESILDGFSIKLSGGIDPPINFRSIELNEGSSTILSSNFTRDNLDIQNYTIFGGTLSSYAIDNFGVGTYDVDQLEDDIELRFTGVYDNGTNINGKTVYQIIEGGSYATCFRMISGTALSEHPLNPSPGTSEPFLVRIPFEVWNVEDPDNQFQVNLAYRDRVRDGSENPFWAWNPNDRMYAVIVNSPYNRYQIVDMDAIPENEFNSKATWVLVFYGTNYHLNDTVKINYANPIQFSDIYNFTMPEAPTDKIFPNKYEIFQNYPNPFNPNTKIRYFIPEDGNVKITIYNILGQRVTEVINKTLKAGKYETEFNGSNFASGVYIYRIEVDSPDKANIYSQTKKMILLK